jgi:hypothetical protein
MSTFLSSLWDIVPTVKCIRPEKNCSTGLLLILSTYVDYIKAIYGMFVNPCLKSRKLFLFSCLDIADFSFLFNVIYWMAIQL